MLIDSCGTSQNVTFQPVLGFMDSTGNISSMRSYTLASGCNQAVGNLMVTGDGGVVAWNADNYGFFAFKVDSTLSPAWAKVFNRKGGVQFIKELAGGDLLAGFTMDTAGAVVARLDANGNFLWCRSYMRPGGMIHDCLIESDSSFIITGFTDSTAANNIFIPLPTDFHPELFMMKLNGTGDVQWCKGYDSAPYLWYTRQWSRIERTTDGNYVVLATMGLPGFNWYHRPCLMKTDPNGDTLWTRAYGATDYNYYGRGLLVHSDGGCVVSGYVQGDLPDANSGLPCLMKMDSLGHLACYEQYIPIQVFDLFPTDSSFTLTSVDGATMQVASVTDTILPPIVVYDGCTFATGLPPAALYRLQSKVKVYPNPTTGRITVQFTDPLTAESYYSVYDTMGRLLYQRPLPQGQQTEEVDLSRFGQGTYVLKFTSPEGVCFERVVLSP
jgi:hypothetical protein